MISIRGRLIRTLVPALAGVMLIGGIILYFAVRGALVSQFDAALQTKVRSLASLTTWTPKGIDFDFADEYMPEFEPGSNAEYFEIRLADGSILEKSHSLKDNESLAAPGFGESRTIWNGVLPDGRSGRFSRLRFEPQVDREDETDGAAAVASGSAPQATVIVARSRGELDRPLQAMSVGLVIAGLVMTAVLIVVVLRAVASGLQPLRRVGQAVESIDDSSLANRIETDETPEELRPICFKLNDLLERLEDAFTRERRFSAAAAHELRTPVAELRTLAEVWLKWPGDSTAFQHAMRQSLDIALQMDRMVAALLQMARAQRGELPLDMRCMSLESVVHHLLGPLEPRLARKSISLHEEVSASLFVNVDRVILESILSNLLENAVEYTPDRGEVRVTASEQADTVRLSVINTNDSLEISDLQSIGEPYWRKDAARTGPSHCGLGLSLVRQLAEASGMTFSISIDTAGDVEASLTIPLGAHESERQVEAVNRVTPTDVLA